ncbi:MAG: nitrate/nitrite transporter NrtS [Hyphomicrobiaceae bacterium]
MVAIVVGSILNLINQGDAIFSSDSLSLWKLGLTYCVPFCVATYGASCAMMAEEHP